jgi:hypothetical protein
MIRATNRFFLAGINHMFFHGTCYSPANDRWPGWLFYASTQLNNRNPLWREMPTLFKYIERSQNILQNSTPKNDVLVYWPYYDVAAGEGKIFNHIGVSPDTSWFYGQPIAAVSNALLENGYTLDFISDRQLLDSKVVNNRIVTSGGAVYKALVIPKTKYIPLKTMSKLTRFIQEGGIVGFDSTLPGSVPGMFEFKERERELQKLKTTIDNNLVGDIITILSENRVIGEVDLSEKGFHFLKMSIEGEDWYMVFNPGIEMKDEWVQLNNDADSYVILNPMTGEINQPEVVAGKVRIQLDMEQSVFIRCSKKDEKYPVYTYQKKDAKSDVDGMLWKVEFIEGGPVFPGNLQMDNLVSWTKMGDQHAQSFAGTVKYSTEFHWNKEIGSACIDLGIVKDCARIKLNGKNVGALPGPVFKIKVDNLINGINSLEVEVTNVAANRIRDLDERGVVWRKFDDINLVNIDYEPFDASDWEIKDAGLLGPVKIYSN